MTGFQENVIRSFRMIKKDILELKGELLQVAEQQEKLDSIVDDLRKGKNTKTTVKKKTVKKKSKK